MPRKLVDDSGNQQGKQWLEEFANATSTGDAGSTFNLLG